MTLGVGGGFGRFNTPSTIFFGRKKAQKDAASVVSASKPSIKAHKMINRATKALSLNLNLNLKTCTQNSK